MDGWMVELEWGLGPWLVWPGLAGACWWTCNSPPPLTGMTMVATRVPFLFSVPNGPVVYPSSSWSLLVTRVKAKPGSGLISHPFPSLVLPWLEHTQTQGETSAIESIELRFEHCPQTWFAFASEYVTNRTESWVSGRPNELGEIRIKIFWFPIVLCLSCSFHSFIFRFVIFTWFFPFVLYGKKVCFGLV